MGAIELNRQIVQQMNSTSVVPAVAGSPSGNPMQEINSGLSGIGDFLGTFNSILDKLVQLQKARALVSPPVADVNTLTSDVKIVKEEVKVPMELKFNQELFLQDLSKAMDNASKLPEFAKSLTIGQIIDPNFKTVVNFPLIGNMTINREVALKFILNFVEKNHKRYFTP